MNRTPRLSVIFASLMAVVVLAGCSPSTASPTAVRSTSAPATSVATTAVTSAATTAATSASATIAATEQATSATLVSTDSVTTAVATGATTSTSTDAVVSSGAAATCTKLNLNTLTEEQLLSTIPNFSNRMVREFMEYRPYTSIIQFRREIGKYVDAAQVTEWEKYVYVPVDPASADVETLKQIPGVTDEMANTLIGGRPYASSQAFLDALGKSVSGDQAIGASCFLATGS